MGFGHLHVHSEYSLLDGIGKPKDILQKAKDLGFNFIAITDHGNLDCYVKAIKYAKEFGVQYIPGCEFYCVYDIEQYRAKKRQEKIPRYHFTVWAKNIKGVNAIFRLLTKAYKQVLWSRPTLQFDDVFENRDFIDNVIVGTACTSGLLNTKDDVLILDFKNVFKNFFIEVMPHDIDIQKVINNEALRCSKRFGISIIATNDVHYVGEFDYDLQEVLMAIQTKASWSDPNRWRLNIQGLYLKTKKEMLEAFSQQGVFGNKDVEMYLENTQMISDISRCVFESIPVDLPDINLSNESVEDILINKVGNGFSEIVNDKKIVGKVYDEYFDRLNEELNTILKMGFAKYFLLVEDIISWSKDNKILIGAGRGSVGGSLVAYCLGITCIDPIEHGLLFFRFISPSRIDLPDIDMDFEDIKRDDIKGYLKSKYGENNVALVSVYTEMHGKGVLRDVSRVFDIPLREVDIAAKAIDRKQELDDSQIKYAFSEIPECREFYNKYQNMSEVVIALENTIKNCGVHAAGMVIVEKDFELGINGYLKQDKDHNNVINWDKDDLEYMGLMKLDILGLNTLTILNEASKLVKERYGDNIDFYGLNYDDPAIFNEFNIGNTCGMFQFGTYGIKKLCVDVGVKNLQDLADINALYRPGTLRSGMVDEYILRKHGNKNIEYIHPYVASITYDTYGIILYQEQVMNLLYLLGGLSWEQVDTIRKVVSKSKGEEEFVKYKKVFVEGCLKKGSLNAQDAERVFMDLKYFASYGFNKAHAIGYSMIAYWCMFMKYYYFSEFFESLLTWTASENKLQEYIDELKRFRYTINAVCPQKSLSQHWFIENGIVYPPICILKGIGLKAAEEIVKPINDNDFWNSKFSLPKLDKRIINSKVMSILQNSGYYGGDIDRSLYPYKF